MCLPDRWNNGAPLWSRHEGLDSGGAVCAFMGETSKDSPALRSAY